MPNPIPDPDDNDMMREAITVLNEAGEQFSRPSKYQLKNGDLSFYPSTGKIFRDGEQAAWSQIGIEIFTSHLRTLKQRNSKISRLRFVEPCEIISTFSLIPPEASDN